MDEKEESTHAARGIGFAVALWVGAWIAWVAAYHWMWFLSMFVMIPDVIWVLLALALVAYLIVGPTLTPPDEGGKIKHDNDR
jgi:hypothetical protein